MPSELDNPNAGVIERVQSLELVLKKLLDFFENPRDKRVWQPDNTCQPFILSASATINAPGNSLLAKFKVPANHVGVITRIHNSLFIAATGLPLSVNKDITTLRISKAMNDSANLTGFDPSPISTHGALQNVQECNPIAPGIVIANLMDTECRIVLEDGSYVLFNVVTQAITASRLTVLISGFTYPKNPR